MGVHASPTRIRGLASVARRPGMVQSIIRTAGFNFGAMAAAGLGGIILARTVGPSVRGDYAAISAWFGVVLMVGAIGQPAALCFYVAREPLRAREYVATSRAMMLTTGAVSLSIGMVFAPLLAHGNTQVTIGYRIAFATSVVAFVAASYTFSLQARDLQRWNVVQFSQPLLSLVAIVVLWRLRLLTLDAAMVVLSATLTLQLIWAYRCCRCTGLAPGHAQLRLVGPLAKYGVAQIAAVAPALLNAQLDQLVLSQTVPSADLGRYAVAVSLTLIPVPLTSAIGNVAFPRLAAQRAVTMRLTGCKDSLFLLPRAWPQRCSCHLRQWPTGWCRWSSARPTVGAVPLLWLLTPGAVFLACGKVTAIVAGQEPSDSRGVGAGSGGRLHSYSAFRPPAGPRCRRCGDRLNDRLRRRARRDAPQPAAVAACH